jgi:hypothetical protein
VDAQWKSFVWKQSNYDTIVQRIYEDPQRIENEDELQPQDTTGDITRSKVRNAHSLTILIFLPYIVICMENKHHKLSLLKYNSKLYYIPTPKNK